MSELDGRHTFSRLIRRLPLLEFVGRARRVHPLTAAYFPVDVSPGIPFANPAVCWVARSNLYRTRGGRLHRRTGYGFCAVVQRWNPAVFATNVRLERGEYRTRRLRAIAWRTQHPAVPVRPSSRRAAGAARAGCVCHRGNSRTHFGTGRACARPD